MNYPQWSLFYLMKEEEKPKYCSAECQKITSLGREIAQVCNSGPRPFWLLVLTDIYCAWEGPALLLPTVPCSTQRSTRNLEFSITPSTRVKGIDPSSGEPHTANPQLCPKKQSRLVLSNVKPSQDPMRLPISGSTGGSSGFLGKWGKMVFS